MADIWDGGTQTTGVIKWELNTDKTAIRFSQTNGNPWPPDIPQILTDQLQMALKRAAEELERVAGDIAKIDTAFSVTLKNKAAAYRAAGALPPASATMAEEPQTRSTANKPGSFSRPSRK